MAHSTGSWRREFLESVGAGAAGLITAGYAARAGGFPANETINVGVIGCGGRAFGSLMPRAMSLPGARVTAVCDLYKRHLDRAASAVRKSGGEPFKTRYFEELLARKDVNAVIIGTPDHWHVPISMAACNAGKDVYSEKPLTHDMKEGQELMDLQKKTGRIIQVGTQQRSIPHIARARELVRSGKLGDIHKVHLSWNRNFLPFRKGAPNIDPGEFDWKRFLGNAKDQPFDPYRAIGNWRWFWDFGAGILGDLMVHWLDVANWVLDLPMPDQAVTAGDHYATMGVWETPDTIQTVMLYRKRKIQIHFEGTFVNQHRKSGMTFMGTRGSLYVDRGRYELHPEPKGGLAPESRIPGKAVKGADFDIDGTVLQIANWLECVRTREKPVNPVESGVLAANAAHFANKAYREKRVMERRM